MWTEIAARWQSPFVCLCFGAVTGMARPFRIANSELAHVEIFTVSCLKNCPTRAPKVSRENPVAPAKFPAGLAKFNFRFQPAVRRHSKLFSAFRRAIPNSARGCASLSGTFRNPSQAKASLPRQIGEK